MCPVCRGAVAVASASCFVFHVAHIFPQIIYRKIAKLFMYLCVHAFSWSTEYLGLASHASQKKLCERLVVLSEPCVGKSAGVQIRLGVGTQVKMPCGVSRSPHRAPETKEF